MNADAQRFVRYPAIRCWIKHILEGKYSQQEKILYTIFGKVKRVRFNATIIDKREIINQNNEVDIDSSDNPQNSRMEVDLDDGTGIIRATIWQANPEEYSYVKKGDLVDVIGVIRQWSNYISISPEVIKIVKDPNYRLLRDAEIIKKIKMGEIKEIPETEDDELAIDELSDEFELNGLFKKDDAKEGVIEKIKELGGETKGISFDKLKEELEYSSEELEKYLSELEIESRIYQSSENHYQLI